MIKLFRRIRSKLLNQGSIKRYVLYAIGEIVLVMVGILLALQVNNWNENRKAVERSKTNLTEFLKDLEDNLLIINYSRNFSIEYLKHESWVLERTDYSAHDVDSLWAALGGHYVFRPINDRTFQKLQNSGETKLMGFDVLDDKISLYFTQSIKRYKEFVEWDKYMSLEGQAYMQDLDERLEMSNFRMDFYARETSPRRFPVAQDSAEQIRTLIDFAKSPRGRNHFKYNYSRHARAKHFLEEIKLETATLITEIRQALKE